ncbi:protein-export membrane protein SecD [Candidatus Uhrbacteria bacterium RIFCSPHIGHO2_02_FULL_47_44]|uniref:Protein translocase subunit SecD n=1 Tax=Candidatus Uhrbacteria bacterium RIFCSPLOWO2_02_FULL_48_18 TaxID=1802408 RepID=A0A1F7VCV1_9BACT|nr:MAG: protein-export membrane protein SecD [Candidatus Uhrbacteria bacterium RIFCSPHIGHO2_01_FULL_47_10]OGL70466.1 MAG: protein-export membrane protein SecD [Candidatus Uhrbacteria bacterium RIFCSPHIGHO2_02_FULL_47_44]OGL76842.1 MAG: protein-export membrane protein SecD [Candidatus Uhrbacteria bacterium RIFCSPHIGHO2_12_FULL_47_12]OGL82311.1 MAG: protein-export membrane protein SecD [Candidatus Uhrbacteria bacterium RIFCSPLOWO2_01_FULL_47_17]OGL87958.1 MAG: protein-export membrane protein SecD
MQTWKTKRKSQNAQKIHKPWKARVAAIIFLLATVVVGFYDFPQAWNQTAGFLKDKVHVSLPTLNEHAYRLGLDLQGGTHLVYEADMKEIPEADRADALAGVRDVIERRVNAFGVSEPLVQTTSTGGAYRVVVELAGVLDVSEAIQQIGETPVLEFKEQGSELDTKPTPADDKKLVELQKADRAAAQAVLLRAQKGENFDELVEEFSIESTKAETKGMILKMTAESTQYPAIAKAVTQYNPKPGTVFWKTVEQGSSMEIFKVTEKTTANNMRLSHILICFEGKQGCSKETTAMEANIQISKLKKEATPQNFSDLAKANSTDPSAATNGGDLGFATSNKYVPAFALAAETLEVGKISDVVETDFGYHLIYKQDQTAIPAYNVQHITMKLSSMTDVLPPASPWKNTGLSGKQLKNAVVEFDQNSGNPHVSIAFDNEGGELFGKLTAANIGKPIAIFLDGTAISTPVVQAAIYGGTAVITGNFDLDEAKILAQRLNAGALPVPVTLLSQQTIGPTLGALSLQKSIIAALIGFALVAGYMIAYYRLAGLFSVIALILYAFLNLVVYRVFDVTITLSGIAGFILSLGMAVDANVLIIERMKEEIASGRDLLSSIHEGFARAWPAIRDGNVSTLVVALVLYVFSASFIKGFALMLGIGVVISLFTAITATRIYMITAFPKQAVKMSWLSGLPKSKKV